MFQDSIDHESLDNDSTRAGRNRIGIHKRHLQHKSRASFLWHFILEKNWGLDYRRTLEKFSTDSKKLLESMEWALLRGEGIRKVAENTLFIKNFFFLGRLYFHELPITMEGSLKLKEISYIHSRSVCHQENSNMDLLLLSIRISNDHGRWWWSSFC